MADTLKTAEPVRPRRRWYRLHLSTLLVLLLGLIVALLVELPGGIGRYPDEPSWVLTPEAPTFLTATDYYDVAVVHGWPFHYLWRTPAGWSGDPAVASWASSIANPARHFRYVSWKLADSVRDFRLCPLLADVALMAACVALFTGLVEWRRRRRRRATQCTLRELLVVTTFAAIAVGWWSRQRAIYLDSKAEFSILYRHTWEPLQPRLPLWIRTLAGDDRLKWIGLNGPGDSFTLPLDSFGPQQKVACGHIVEIFPHQAVVEISDQTSDDDAAAIASIATLERIDFAYMSVANRTRLLSKFARHPNLREVVIIGDHASQVGDGDLALVATLPRLQSLSCDGGSVTERGLAKLRDCKNLTNLELIFARLTNGGLDCLADIKRLRRLNLDGSTFIDHDVSALARLGDLEELCLWLSTLDDAQALRLRSLPNLRRLNIAHRAAPGLTAAGVKRVLDPSGGGFARNLEQLSLDADLIDDELVAVLKKLPRLHLIGVVWEENEGPSSPSGVHYRRLILKLRQALPDRDIIALPIRTLIY